MFVAQDRSFSVGPLAQRSEQRTHNPLVEGSNPSGPTKANPCEIYIDTQERGPYVQHLMEMGATMIATNEVASIVDALKEIRDVESVYVCRDGTS